MSRDEGKGSENAERIRQVLYKLAYKQLQQDEWKRLACNWAFTDEQIKAIEHQYTGRHHVILARVRARNQVGCVSRASFLQGARV